MKCDCKRVYGSRPYISWVETCEECAWEGME